MRDLIDDLMSLSRIEADQSPEKRQRPIIAHLEYVAPKTETIQYKPDEGDDEDWEIGQPYIPTPMTFDESERLTMTVNWK